MRKFFITLMVFAGLILLLPEAGHSIPAFARKYGFNCNMCHTSFTKLNDFGQRFRDNGYQIPGQEGPEKSVFETAPPIALRTSTGLVAAHSSQKTSGAGTTQDNSSGFELVGFDFLAAGVMHKNVSFLIIYTPRIDEPAADQTGTTPLQPGALESANIVFSNVVQNAVNFRLGRFEPAYHLTSSKRSYYLMEPYEIYTFSPDSNSFQFNDNQLGVEMTGHFKMGCSYGLGVVNGTGALPDNNKFKDVYLTLSQVIGQGEGQSAGQKISIFGYMGWQPTVSLSGPPSVGEGAGVGNKPFTKFGADVSLNWSTFNFRTFFMSGSDPKELNFLQPSKKYDYTGGFAELDYSGLANNRLLLSALYNWVTPPTYDNGRKISAISGLVRYYLGDWKAVNVALHAEYTHRQTGKTDPLKEDHFAGLIDFDF